MNEIEQFRQSLTSALERAVARLLEIIGDEKLYAVSLYTSGEDGFSYVCFSANTEERLQATAETYARKYSDYVGVAGRKRLRWSVGDWGCHNFSPEVRELGLPTGEDEQRDQAVYEVFVECLQRLQERPDFAQLNPRIIFLITCGDMSDEFFLVGLQRLNPLEVVEAYLEEFTPTPFFRRLQILPIAEQRETVFALYRDLALGILSPMAMEAATQNLDQYALRGVLSEFGDDAIVYLLDLVERYGFGPIFNEKGSPAYKQFGAFTAENRLATSAIFTLCDWDRIDPQYIQRMQEILRKRIEADRALPITSTLAENIARVLHQLAPESFPKSQLDPKTNHLRNPEPFLPD